MSALQDNLTEASVEVRLDAIEDDAAIRAAFIAEFSSYDVPKLLDALAAVAKYCAEEQTGSGEVSADGVMDAIDEALR